MGLEYDHASNISRFFIDTRIQIPLVFANRHSISSRIPGLHDAGPELRHQLVLLKGGSSAHTAASHPRWVQNIPAAVEDVAIIGG